MGKTEEDQSVKILRYIKNVLIGGVIALAICLLWLVLVSVGISNGLFDMDFVYQFTLLGCVIGSFFGGRWAIGRCGTRALVVGLVVGGILFLLLLSIGVICFGGSPESGGIGLFCACLCGGTLSGFLGLGGKKKKKRRK